MMMETKYFIGLDDILRVQFECKQCHTQTSAQPGGKLLYFCPACGAQWLFPQGEPDILAREALWAILNAKEAVPKDKPVVISIEIKGRKADS